MKKLLTIILAVCATAIYCHAVTPPFNVVIMGDSNAALGGDSCTVERGWTYWFKQQASPLTCISYARNGATWTDNAITKLNLSPTLRGANNDNGIYNQVNRFKENYKNGDQPEPGLIIIAAGSCDGWLERQRPEMYNMTVDKAFKTPLQDLLMKKAHLVTSLAESVRFNCEVLRESFPDATIVLLAPMQTMIAAEPRNSKVADIIGECGKRLGITVIRLDKELPVKSSEERIKKRYTTNGSDTSVEGAQLIANKVLEVLGKK